MSDLIAVSFADEFRADEVLLALNRLQREHLIDLEDAAVVVRKKDGRLQIKQVQNLIAAGAAGGSVWGLLIGLLFLDPLAGLLVGPGAGVVAGALADIGIDEAFIRELGAIIEPSSSALFVLVRKVTPDKVLEELKPFAGKVLRTSLSKADEAALRKALGAHKEAVAAVNAAEPAKI